MTYRLFIDDDAGKPGVESWRNPPDDTWRCAHTSAEAISIIDMYGPPSYISFDHDLGLKPSGLEDTAKDVCKYLFDTYPDANIDYDVHSKNPNGKAWIESYMDSWKRSKDL